MASSFIRFNENGFWISDYMMEITLSFVLETAKDESVRTLWPDIFWEDMRENSLGYFTGFMSLSLDEYLDNETRKQAFVDLLKNTIRMLNDKYDMLIPVEDMNAFMVKDGVQTEWMHPLEKSRIIKVLEFLLLVIRGYLVFKPGDTIDYEF